ncbi:aldehyde dehydrogenase family protein, partial [Pseudoalteromonas marina]
DPDVGPLAREDLRDGIHDHVMHSVKAGANFVTGGEIPSQTGYYYPHKILDKLSTVMPAYDDELFGPFASLIKAKVN